MSLVNHALDVNDVQTLLVKVYLDTVGAPSSDLHYAYSDDEACELRDRLREVDWIRGDHWALTRAGALRAAELARRGWNPFPPDVWTNRDQEAVEAAPAAARGGDR